ncbi:DNA primase [Paramagnetospirillum magneticum]|uniref:DNA primase n=1 Tax=Paramagnetospirillum magneticum (strain ATCC 700264 / AMB-1) TaxID=342108 RepID=Q2W753_PARM1|nr:DNA primase [Paramagnetospirillum magneticum]BAE50322.1 DNA primase [Paramagnetospirillum magneticum AMB-1]
MIPKGFLDEIRDRVPVSAVVGRRVALAKKGREFTGLCPFHNEKTPSFTVNDDKGFFKCFGCGAHGNAIGFLERAHGLSFVEAVEELAAEAGLEVPKASPEERRDAAARASLYEANEAACAWFEHQLTTTKAGADALFYLSRRGVAPETRARFRLGWAPNGDALRRALDAERFPDDLLIEAGLLRRRDDGTTGAFFRGRVMFPIMDRRGRVIGFGARTLSADPGVPKYLNSPDTPLFRKGEVLYGLSHARDGAAEHSRAVVVEGYLDVIAMHQGGFPYAVAPLGTALTPGQVEEIWRLTPDGRGEGPILMLDGDRAGAAAMRRAAEVAVPILRPGRSLRFAQMPEGAKDPDELLNPPGDSVGPQEGAFRLASALGAARPLADVLWEALVAEIPPDTPERFAALEARAYGLAVRINDHAVRRAYLADWRRRLGEAEDMDPPVLRLGSAKTRFAPAKAHLHLGLEWRRALRDAKGDKGEASPVKAWLEERGISWEGVARALGGLGVVRARVVKGRWDRQWSAVEPASLWEPWAEAGAPVKLILIPEWEGGPGGRLVDLIGWNPKTDECHSRTGRTVTLLEDAVAEAMGLEAQGLPSPVAIAASPLSWLRRMAKAAEAEAKARRDKAPPPEADRCVYVVDWARAWDVLGGLRQVVAESEAHWDLVNKLLRPPRWRRPDIGYVVEG